MSISAALNNSIFINYLIIALSLLGACGLLLLLNKLVFKKDLQTVWKIYKGWLFIVPFVFSAVFLGREAFIILVALLSIFGFKEFARATGLYNDWWMTGAVYISIIAMGIICIMPDPLLPHKGWFGLFKIFPVYAVVFMFMIPVIRNKAKGQLQAVSLAIVGFIYFGWMFFHLGFMANSSNPYGYILFLIVAVQINDISAFIFGKFFGKRKLRSEISPNKTIGGSLGAIGVSMLMPWAFSFSFPHFGVTEKLIIGLIIGIGGQLGDLTISFIKRDLGVKDMGCLIPGHGGILDRIDSLIYTAPLFFHMINWHFGIYGGN